VDLTLVRAGLVARAGAVVEELLGKPNPLISNKREWRYGRKGSMSVAISGPRAGCWYDHETSEGGDLLDLIQRERGGDFKEAVREGGRLLGTSSSEAPTRLPQPRREASYDDAARTRRALELWREAKPIGFSLAAEYLLIERGITELPPRLDGSARFHPNCPFGQARHPCLVGLMRDVRTNEPKALHRTALTAEGRKLDRRVFGPKAGACIKLSPDDDVELGLTIGEGIETVLAGMRLDYRPAWACGDAGNLAAFPVLAGIDALTILTDHDDAGQRAAAMCAERWLDASVEVFRVKSRSPGEDINDLIEGAPA
jgi:Toprim domain